MTGALHFPEFAASIRWTETGSGRPLVVLPGLSIPVGPSFQTLTADPRFADRRLVLIDYLGSGASDHPRDFDYALAPHARTVAAVFDHLGLRGVDVLGHSMGGTVGIRLALDRPDFVGRLLVAEGNLIPGGGMASRRIVSEDLASFAATGLAALLEEMRQAGLTRLAEGWAMADPSGIWGNAHGLVHLDPGFRDDYLALAIPRTFVIGEKNLASGPTPDAPEPSALEAAGVRVIIIPGAGHAMMLDNPPAFAEAVAEAFPLGA
jgi:pimeloyl-ACP methyl ester carboxylesterase